MRRRRAPDTWPERALVAVACRKRLFARPLGLARRRSQTPIPADEPAPAADPVSTKRKFTEIRVFACLLAELVAPPTMRDHAETSSAMIADLALSHHTLARHLNW